MNMITDAMCGDNAPSKILICKNKILANMKNKIPIITYDVINSTNDAARSFLADHSLERIVFVANEQTDGRGRYGKKFYSPANTGIYMTYAFRSPKLCGESVHITGASCVAVAQALNCGAKIKWVNDLYFHGKKICGILTETLTNNHNDFYVLVGIGINITTKEFPSNISKIAGSINVELDREILVAKICDNMSLVASDIFSSEYLEYYRSHMLGVGCPIVYTQNDHSQSAIIEGVDDLCRLVIRKDGRQEVICSGEITVNSFQMSEEK